MASDACSGSIEKCRAGTPALLPHALGLSAACRSAKRRAPRLRVVTAGAGAGERRCGVCWPAHLAPMVGVDRPPICPPRGRIRLASRAGACANRPAKSALRVEQFGPDAPWAHLKRSERTLTKCSYFQALSAWARLGSNQRPLACEARRPRAVPRLGCRCSSRFLALRTKDLRVAMPLDCGRLLRLLGTGAR